MSFPFPMFDLGPPCDSKGCKAKTEEMTIEEWVGLAVRTIDRVLKGEQEE